MGDSVKKWLNELGFIPQRVEKRSSNRISHRAVFNSKLEAKMLVNHANQVGLKSGGRTIICQFT
jgi:hypothetical protein